MTIFLFMFDEQINLS